MLVPFLPNYILHFGKPLLSGQPLLSSQLALSQGRPLNRALTVKHMNYAHFKTMKSATFNTSLRLPYLLLPKPCFLTNV